MTTSPSPSSEKNTSIAPDEIKKIWREAEQLCVQAEVEAAFDQMAQAINKRLHDSNPLCLCVMTGGIIPTGQLLPRLDFPLELDYIHLNRYRGDVRGDTIHWLRKPAAHALEGRVILLIDDILDEGLTLSSAIAYCREQGARETYVAVLADKQRERGAGGLEKADFTGLTIPNRYVFGYGLDYRSYWRNAPGVYAVKGL